MTSALAGFRPGPQSWSNGYLEKPGKKKREKNPEIKARAIKLNPHMASGRNRTQAMLVGVKRSHHCANPALLFIDVL